MSNAPKDKLIVMLVMLVMLVILLNGVKNQDSQGGQHGQGDQGYHAGHVGHDTDLGERSLRQPHRRLANSGCMGVWACRRVVRDSGSRGARPSHAGACGSFQGGARSPGVTCIERLWHARQNRDSYSFPFNSR